MLGPSVPQRLGEPGASLKLWYGLQSALERRVRVNAEGTPPHSRLTLACQRSEWIERNPSGRAWVTPPLGTVKHISYRKVPIPEFEFCSDIQ